jgi:hypothetical protein
VLSDAVADTPKDAVKVAQDAAKDDAAKDALTVDPTESVKNELAKSVKDATSDPLVDAARNAVKDAVDQAIEEARPSGDDADDAPASAPTKPGGQTEIEPDSKPAAAREGSTGTVLATPVPAAPDRPVEVPSSFEKADAPSKTAESSDVGSKAAPSALAGLEPYGPERPLRPGPITVFVSKKEGKVFVRKAFQPVLTASVTIANPEVPLGTHIFTAIDARSDGVSFDWLAVSMPSQAAKKAEVRFVHDRYGRRIEKTVARAADPPPSSTAAEALARIEIPPYALARISELMSAGASLIVSDQGLGYETGTETDFIVLTR